MFRTHVVDRRRLVSALRPAGRAPRRPRAPPARRRQAGLHRIVNLNTASAADLEGLPGIGAKTAARIVEYRQKNGPFKKVEELMNVRGVGEKNFLKLKPQITVGAGKGGPRTAEPAVSRSGPAALARPGRRFA